MTEDSDSFDQYVLMYILWFLFTYVSVYEATFVLNLQSQVNSEISVTNRSRKYIIIRMEDMHEKYMVTEGASYNQP